MASDLELPRLSAVELRRLIGARKLSPVELLDACIARMERYNPAVNAIAATDFERARGAARAAEAAVMRGDALGALHGLPLGVKDLQDTAGLLTTYGNAGLRGNVPTADNTLVARLRAAGAIVTAKTNVPDMGAGANTRNPVWGATGNPFDPRLNAAGCGTTPNCCRLRKRLNRLWRATSRPRIPCRILPRWDRRAPNCAASSHPPLVDGSGETAARAPV